MTLPGIELCQAAPLATAQARQFSRERRQEFAPAGDPAIFHHRLRAIGVVQGQNRGLCENVGGAPAGRMIGMIGPDDKLRQQIDTAIDQMLTDGTIARIYAGYGIELRPPE